MGLPMPLLATQVTDNVLIRVALSAGACSLFTFGALSFAFRLSFERIQLHWNGTTTVSICFKGLLLRVDDLGPVFW